MQLINNIGAESLLLIIRKLDKIEDLCKSKVYNAANELMTNTEFCETFKLSKSTASRLRAKGLPYYRIGNRIYYKKECALAFFEQHKSQ